MALPSLVRSLLDPLAPEACAVCAVPGSPLCAGCRVALVPVRPPGCARCGHPWPEPAPRCRACLPGLPPARAAFHYDGAAAALVSAMKDRRRRVLAEVLAAETVGMLGPPPSGFVLVPVPLSRRRLADRGFDQALAIADGLAARWRRSLAPVLARSGDDAPQRGAPRARRLALRTAFRCRGPCPPRCCVVDDVHTTGATLSAAARALRAAGAREVVATTVFRVPAPGTGPLGAVARAGRA